MNIEVIEEIVQEATALNTKEEINVIREFLDELVEELDSELLSQVADVLMRLE